MFDIFTDFLKEAGKVTGRVVTEAVMLPVEVAKATLKEVSQVIKEHKEKS